MSYTFKQSETPPPKKKIPIEKDIERPIPKPPRIRMVIEDTPIQAQIVFILLVIIFVCMSYDFIRWAVKMMKCE